MHGQSITHTEVDHGTGREVVVGVSVQVVVSWYGRGQIGESTLGWPQHRLRVNDIRVFHDIVETEAQVLAIVTTAEAQEWLDAFGERSP